MSRLSPRKRFTSSGSSSSTSSRSANWALLVNSAKTGLRPSGSGPGPLHGLLAGSSDSIRDTQPLMHDRAGGRVLEELPLLRKEMMLDRESGERSFVEARQDELFLAGIGVDVTHGEDPRQARLELLRVDPESLLLELESPFGDRSELRMQAEEDQEMLRLQRMHRAVMCLDVDTLQCPVRRDE